MPLPGMPVALPRSKCASVPHAQLSTGTRPIRGPLQRGQGAGGGVWTRLPRTLPKAVRLGTPGTPRHSLCWLGSLRGPPGQESTLSLLLPLRRTESPNGAGGGTGVRKWYPKGSGRGLWAGTGRALSWPPPPSHSARRQGVPLSGDLLPCTPSLPSPAVAEALLWTLGWQRTFDGGLCRLGAVGLQAGGGRIPL